MQYLKQKRHKMKKSTADKWFSLFIRLRDIVYTESCRCITCEKPIHWKYEADCGHFVTRGHAMTRFDERNCNAQCKACNNDKKGDQYRHGRAIDKKFGEGAADLLTALGSVRDQKVHGQLALKDIAKEFRLKAKAMAKTKGVEL